MSPAILELALADVEALRAELETNLKKGRAFVVGATGLTERTACTLVVVHPETRGRHAMPAEVVYVKADEPGMGVGVKLDPFDASAVEALRAFVEARGQDASAEQPPALAPAEAPELPEQDDDEPAADPATRTLQERVRALSMIEQQRMARNGSLPERIALERTFGSSVWEPLLSNSRLSVPEVARIAKKGTLPKPLIDVIAANGAWMGAPEVQRALLSNPRTSAAVVTKVLRALPRADLVRVAQQTAYPMTTRQAAKKMVKDA